ncbi:winged helix-turn-helix domain-containing protein [Streptomyces sp. CSMPJR101]|uniref:winged helix-turn-helix domain-containing protein n=1 Tax=Streptomyces sp. CSMPJR101 TaxID=1279378 RepID=UPI0038523257
MCRPRRAAPRTGRSALTSGARLTAPGQWTVEEPPTFCLLHGRHRTRQVQFGQEPVALSPKEYDLLVCLADDPGAVCTRQYILDTVWQPNYFGPTKTLDVHIAVLAGRRLLPRGHRPRPAHRAPAHPGRGRRRRPGGRTRRRSGAVVRLRPVEGQRNGIIAVLDAQDARSGEHGLPGVRQPAERPRRPHPGRARRSPFLPTDADGASGTGALPTPRYAACGERSTSRVISLGAKTRNGGPQKPVPRLV